METTFSPYLMLSYEYFGTLFYPLTYAMILLKIMNVPLDKFAIIQ
jgi:hypothetical protein